MFLQIIQAKYPPIMEEYPPTAGLPVASTAYDMRNGYMPGITTQADSRQQFNQPGFRYPPYGGIPSDPYSRRQFSLPGTHRYGPQSEPVVETPSLVSV